MRENAFLLSIIDDDGDEVGTSSTSHVVPAKYIMISVALCRGRRTVSRQPRSVHPQREFEPARRTDRHHHISPSDLVDRERGRVCVLFLASVECARSALLSYGVGFAIVLRVRQ